MSATLMTSARRILMIKHGAFGDVVQSEGAVRDIRANHPSAHISVLTTPAYARIFKRCPWIDEVLIDPRASRWRLDLMWRLGRMLRAAGFDMVYDLQNSGRTAAYRRFMLPRTPWSGAAPGCSHPHLRPEPKQLPSLERLATQLEDAGLTVAHARFPDVSWMAEDVSEVLREAGIAAPYIVLIPGCSARHPQKRWPCYADLARRLMEEGWAVVTAPGPDDIELSRAMPSVMLMATDRCLNWFELAGLLKGAAFVVGNDTGPSHLAAHLGAPGLALFGPHTTAARTSIERENFKAIEVADLSTLSVDRVLDAARAQLRAPTGPKARADAAGSA